MVLQAWNLVMLLIDVMWGTGTGEKGIVPQGREGAGLAYHFKVSLGQMLTPAVQHALEDHDPASCCPLMACTACRATTSTE